MKTNTLFAIRIFSHYRRRSSNIRATGMLTEQRQEQNNQTLKTNIQVTCVIWMLETFSNFSVVFIWMFVAGELTHTLESYGMLWNMLILPYTYLMNTSHNKRLLRDNGWLNTIQNAIPLPFRRQGVNEEEYGNDIFVIEGERNQNNANLNNEQNDQPNVPIDN